jgi:hypothetical protein
MEDVGIGELAGQGAARHVARQRCERAVLRIGCQVLLGEVGVEHGQHLGIAGAQFPQEALARADHLGEQIFLRFEVGVESASCQAGGQHDVVDIGAGIAAQPEQPPGMTEDFGPDTERLSGVRRHFMSIIISYDDRHIKF